MTGNNSGFEEFYAEQQKIFNAIWKTAKISDLNTNSRLEYLVSDYKEIINKIVEENDVIAVSGAYFGDEGKGKMIDALSVHPLIKFIARLNSGENAGHTVKHKEIEFIFHLTPSGILIPEKTCLIGPECVMDPINYMHGEIEPLKQAGVDYKNRLIVGNVHIVNPTSKILDFLWSAKNASTLQGMAFIHALKSMKAGIRLDDIFGERLRNNRRLMKELEFYDAMIGKKAKDEAEIYNRLQQFSEETCRKIPEHIYKFLKAKDKVQFLEDRYNEFVINNPDFPERGDINHIIKEALRRHEKLAVELAQAYWLSNATEKHWSSSTSAQTHLSGTIASSSINITTHKIANINTAKTPNDSRVGLGANPSSYVPQDYFSSRNINRLEDLENRCIDFDIIQKRYYESIQPNGILKPTIYKDPTGTYVVSEAMAISSVRKFKEKGATTSKPRVTGLFDCLAAKQVNDHQGPYLFLSAIDRGDEQDYVGLTVGYVFHHPENAVLDSNGIKYKNGKIIRIGDPYPCDDILKYCHPIIKVMPSWKNSPIGTGKFDKSKPLPEELQKFFGTIEELTGFTIIGFGNGRDSNDVVYIKKSEQLN